MLWERLPRDAPGQASRDEWAEAGRSAPEGVRDKSAKASRRGVIAALIVESEARPLGRVVVESLGVTPVGERR